VEKKEYSFQSTESIRTLRRTIGKFELSKKCKSIVLKWDTKDPPWKADF